MTPPPKHPHPELLKKGDTVGVFWEKWWGGDAEKLNGTVTKVTKRKIYVGSYGYYKDGSKVLSGMRKHYLCTPTT